jgi:hypothetical protein
LTCFDAVICIVFLLYSLFRISEQQAGGRYLDLRTAGQSAMILCCMSNNLNGKEKEANVDSIRAAPVPFCSMFTIISIIRY